MLEDEIYQLLLLRKCNGVLTTHIDTIQAYLKRNHPFVTKAKTRKVVSKLIHKGIIKKATVRSASYIVLSPHEIAEHKCKNQ